MKRRIVPFLVLFMTFSLVGIIVVQYKWIQKTISEKQSLVESQVSLSLTNVEEQLNDIRGAELIEERISSLVKFTDSSHYSRSVVISLDSHSIVSTNDYLSDSLTESITELLEELPKREARGKSRDHTGNINRMIKLIQKIDFEKSDKNSDIRLDSLNILKTLNNEFSAQSKIKIYSWGVFDNKSDQYK